MLKSIRFLSLTVFAALAWSSPVLAQSAQSPAGSDSDDLEVPSNPTVPGTAAPKPLPESKPESKPVPAPEKNKAAANPDDSALQRELAELRARIEAVEHERATAPLAPKPEAARPASDADTKGSAYLEKNAISRPVPTGLRIGG